MTATELQAMITTTVTQNEDFIQSVVIEMLNINKRTISLDAGSTDVIFEFPFDIGIDWDFTFLKATAVDGADIGVIITVPVRTGFTVTVEEDCTFKFKAESFNEYISD